MVKLHRITCRLLAIGCSLLLLHPSPGHSAELSLELDKTAIEMGKYAVASISYVGSHDPGAADLSQWRDDFFIDPIDTELEATEQGQIHTLTRLRLYPRRSGDLSLDSIALGGSFIKPQHLLISPSIRNGIDATPRLLPMKASYWADQAIDIRVEVALHDQRNEVVAADFELPGFSLQTLKPERVKTPTGDRIRLGWIIMSPQKGHYRIELPAIDQRGRGRFRFYLPPLQLNIQPIPAYLPPTVAVGQLRVDSGLSTSTGGQRQWQLTVENEGRLPPQLEGLQALLDKLGIDELDLQVLNDSEDSTGLTRRMYTIPLPAWYLGGSQTLQLPFFNTATGRLETLHHQLPTAWQLPRPALWGAIFLLTLLLFYGGYRLNRQADKIRQRWRYRQAIQQAQTAHQLRRQLLLYHQARTLTDWARLQTKPTQQLACELNAACFGEGSQPSLGTLKKSCLRHSQPLDRSLPTA